MSGIELAAMPDVEPERSEAPRTSLKPVEGANRSLRRHLGIKGELALALLPTVTVLAVLGLVEAFSRQRLLFASLASSAFLIYLDPQHGTNSVRTLVFSQMLAAIIGWATFLLFGPGYLAAAGAMVLVIGLMIVLDVVHPPAVATALSFAFRAGHENNLLLFGMALGLIVVLVALERVSLWLLARYSPKEDEA
ncbi:MAG: HPP family protein [Armatimonadota bacterium]|nr:HPP family protein [Armatimonadota bacterium]